VTLAIKFPKSLLIVVIRGKFWYYDKTERQKTVSNGIKWEILLRTMLPNKTTIL